MGKGHPIRQLRRYVLNTVIPALKRQLIKPFDLTLLDGKTVALVGNASRLLKQDYAQAIDAHDIVIRMNLGYPWTAKKDPNCLPLPHQKWIQDIFMDTKTHPPTSCFIVDSNAPAKISSLCVGYHTGFKTDIWSCATSDKKRQRFYKKYFKKVLILWLHPSLKQLDISLLFKAVKSTDDLHRHFKHNLSIQPSSGLMLIELLYRSKAKSIDLYGFDFFETTHIHRTHNTREFIHSPTIEREYVLKLLSKDPRIVLHGYQTETLEDV